MDDMVLKVEAMEKEEEEEEDVVSNLLSLSYDFTFLSKILNVLVD
jgi:hypothetical protein